MTKHWTGLTAVRALSRVLLLIVAFVCGVTAFHGNTVNLHLVFLSIQSVLLGIWFERMRP